MHQLGEDGRICSPCSTSNQRKQTPLIGRTQALITPWNICAYSDVSEYLPQEAAHGVVRLLVEINGANEEIHS